MPVNSLQLSAMPVTAPASLARFSLAGLQYVVVPLTECRSGANGLVGTLTVAGRRYAIVGEKCAEIGPDPIETLTPRELEVAFLVAAGHETKAIARRLRISFHTVRVYVGRIYVKLRLHKQTELAACIAARFGTARDK